MKNWFSVIAIVLFIVSSSCLAQTYNTRFVTVRDGLSSGYINHIFQDEKGFIWISSNTGFMKFNGYEIKVFKSENKDSTSVSISNTFKSLKLPSGEMLVISTEGLFAMDPAREIFRKLNISAKHPEINSPSDLKVMDDGSFWTTTNKGLYYFRKQDLGVDTLGVEFYSFHSDRSAHTGPRRPVIGLDGQNNSVFVAFDSALYEFDTTQKTYKQAKSGDPRTETLLSSSIWEIEMLNDGSVLVSSLLGLAIRKKGEDFFTKVDKLGDVDITGLDMQSIFETENGDVFLGSGTGGAFIWNPEKDQTQRFLHEEKNDRTIASDDVHYFFKDNTGNYWFGHHNLGLSILNSNSWDYELIRPMPDKPVDDKLNLLQSIHFFDDGSKLMATSGGVIFQSADGDSKVLESEPNKLYQNLMPFGNKFISIASTSSMDKSSVSVIDKDKMVVEAIEMPDTLGILQWSLELDESIVFTTIYGKLLLLDKEDFTVEIKDVPLFKDKEGRSQPSLIERDVNGNLLLLAIQVGMENPPKLELASYYYTPEEDLLIENPEMNIETFSRMSKPTISKHREGIFYAYVGTGVLEVNVINSQSRMLFEKEAGIIGESASEWMVEDAEGNLWVENSTGIMKLNPLDGAVSYFDFDPASKPKNIRYPENTNNGKIAFMAEGGYVLFDPEQIGKEDQISSIYVSEIMNGDDSYVPIYSQETLTFPSSANNLTFSYLGLNFIDPVSTQYRYRINGYDDQWVEVGTQRKVFLANLPAGDYTFEVQAAGKSGGYSEASGFANFKILPPWWQTTTAYFGYGILLIASIFAVDQIQRKRLLAKEREKNREKELKQARELEKAYEKLEGAYENLQAAQDQLIQQEKLASLGQLTAGIAHEIKNPLNFVNNFSDVSLELLEEIRDELKSAKIDNEELNLLLTDVEANVKKIHQHGQRADSIVKSMLQHSRGGTGIAKPTDLNEAIREYVNLSFHGMRATKNPINVEIDLKLDENIKQVNLIAEDFTRVILNICNNAFDAMREKVNSLNGDSGYKPLLQVQTIKNGEHIIIEIEDNGPGIPEELKNKILQPFFTTKKGTEGTGLGLSITHDIIKAHGGSLEIKSEKDKQTIFKITIPNS